ncbi:MAG: NERD domain-containing protein [Gemmatimonadota bacterium]|nr:NERD domain-containing protein [Gemmatimonadota bacterium]
MVNAACSTTGVMWLSLTTTSIELPSEALLPWLVLAFLVVAFVLGSARLKGAFGEFRVKAATGLRLDGQEYRSLHNLTLPTRDGTTQIDHVIVSRFGVFVIETKRMKGWIFGDERSRKWTQSIFGNNYRFQNPLRQNYKHLKAVEELVDLGPRCFHSVVVFVGRCRFKTTMPPNVIKRRQLVRYIRSKTVVLLSDEQVLDAVRILKGSRLSKRASRRHLRNLRRNERDPICPRCGKTMVLRTARRGPHPGSQFWGCSGYPRCRATRDAG